MSYEPIPIQGCRGCEGTAGVWGCPVHSPNFYVKTPKIIPFTIMCPYCGKEIELDIDGKVKGD